VIETIGFDEFVAARSPRLLRTAYLLTRDWAAAEDLLQTALAKSWLAWGRIHGDPEPYVRAVIANTFVSMRRRLWRREVPTEHLPEHSETPGFAVDDREALWTALGHLPRRQRAVIVLRYFEDLTEAQTAAALRINVGTVKSQTSKALATLRVDPTLDIEHPVEGRRSR
jgi:RNA polymerase sigma-70 factor (sigma-E family)